MIKKRGFLVEKIIYNNKKMSFKQIPVLHQCLKSNLNSEIELNLCFR